VCALPRLVKVSAELWRARPHSHTRYGAAVVSVAGAAAVWQLFYMWDHHSRLCYNLTGISAV